MMCNNNRLLIRHMTQLLHQKRPAIFMKLIIVIDFNFLSIVLDQPKVGH
jgi:hypothetical protein